jgi:hypothetical protein
MLFEKHLLLTKNTVELRKQSALLVEIMHEENLRQSPSLIPQGMTFGKMRGEYKAADMALLIVAANDSVSHKKKYCYSRKQTHLHCYYKIITEKNVEVKQDRKEQVNLEIMVVMCLSFDMQTNHNIKKPWFDHSFLYQHKRR